MTTPDLILLFTASALCGFGWAMIAYSGYASPRMWRVGEFYAADFSLLQGVAYLGMLGALLFGYIAAGWWGPIVVLVLANIFTRILFPIARERTQLIAPPALLLLGVACTLIWLLRPSGS